jgi:hypothetical protein
MRNSFNRIVFIGLFCALQLTVAAQDPTFVFYLHGGIVQEQGEDAVSDRFGRYEYRGIIQTLEAQGFVVLSEVRKKGTLESDYAKRIKLQIDSLYALGVAYNHIVVVGASQGAYIALETALLVRQEQLRYALLGLCSDYAVGYYKPHAKKIRGHFLSIYERTDNKGSCSEIFQKSSAAFDEIELNLGVGHGFLFRPYEEWILPLSNWIKEER